MHSNRVLRTCMQVLVLLNLVFVQMTEAAGLHALIPLYLLTLGAPLWYAHAEKRAYWWTWNILVVAVFGLLIRHATRGDLAQVLEYGLVLAVLCQVHLLNNLRSAQRPDLLFFNAFLIAVVAGYINRGTSFPIVFLAFAPAFVIGVQLLGATRGGRVLEPSTVRRLMIDGGKRSVALLGISMLVFLFWPRDFQRKAFFHGSLDMSSEGPKKLELGFNEELLLRRKGKVADLGKPTLRVYVIEGDRADVPSLWRGATLSVTDGEAWSPMDPQDAATHPATDEPWSIDGQRLRRGAGPVELGTVVEVARVDTGTKTLFVPLDAQELQVASGEPGDLHHGALDGSLKSPSRGELTYRLAFPATEPELPRGGRFESIPPELEAFLEVPPSTSLAKSLAADLADELPKASEQQAIVAHLLRHLERSYVYVPPGSDSAAETLDEFLDGDGGGHCEFFASALANMLRSLRIPCRVVTGYRSQRWDPKGRMLSFGSGDAHAWVEVRDPKAGWYTVDPSPAFFGTESSTSLWAELQGKLRQGWQAVTGFDAEARAAAFAWARALPGRAFDTVVRRPFTSLASAFGFSLLIAGLLRLRRRKTAPAVRQYSQALRRAKLRRAPEETPRELLERARSLELAPSLLGDLEDATAAHEAARYSA